MKGIVLSVDQQIPVELNEDNKCHSFITKSFAHGFVILRADVILQYKYDNFYTPQHKVLFFCMIQFQGLISYLILLSKKDINHHILKDANWLFDYNGKLY